MRPTALFLFFDANHRMISIFMALFLFANYAPAQHSLAHSKAEDGVLANEQRFAYNNQTLDKGRIGISHLLKEYLQPPKNCGYVIKYVSNAAKWNKSSLLQINMPSAVWFIFQICTTDKYVFAIIVFLIFQCFFLLKLIKKEGQFHLKSNFNNEGSTRRGSYLMLTKEIDALRNELVDLRNAVARYDQHIKTDLEPLLQKQKPNEQDCPYEKQPDEYPPINAGAFLPTIRENFPTSGKEEKQCVLKIVHTTQPHSYISTLSFDNNKIFGSKTDRMGWEIAIEQIPGFDLNNIRNQNFDDHVFYRKTIMDSCGTNISFRRLRTKCCEMDWASGLGIAVDSHAQILSNEREKLQDRLSQQVIEPSGSGDQERGSTSCDEKCAYNSDKAFLEKASSLVEDHIDNPDFGVEMLARKMTMSPPVLYKKLKAETNMSVNDFIKSLRMKKAVQLLRQRNMAVYEVCYAIGYVDRKYFSKEFKKLFGKTPREFAATAEL